MFLLLFPASSTGCLKGKLETPLEKIIVRRIDERDRSAQHREEEANRQKNNDKKKNTRSQRPPITVRPGH
ncbi:hypothetical protein QE152_g33488 [Popillia japonica]|uniref:Secreted protein n=1 Tax=Popillia japonica TaxID=7064 RepID=A0AAW1IWT0_POPJA